MGKRIKTIYKILKLQPLDKINTEKRSIQETELNELSTQVSYLILVQLADTKWIVEYLPYHFQS